MPRNGNTMQHSVADNSTVYLVFYADIMAVLKQDKIKYKIT
jgi:hypothetical protein